MRTVLSFLPARAVGLLGLLGLALAQTGCAHPVWVEPSVVVQARVGGPGYGPAYGAYGSVVPMYGPPPVVVSPAPVWVSPPAPLYMPPRVVLPAPVYRPGWWGGHHDHHREHGRGGHGGWR